MDEDEEESAVYVPTFKRGARWVAKGVTLARFGIIAVLSSFLIYGIATDGLPELMLDTEFLPDHPDCLAPERFAISVHNGSWKTTERVEVLIEARRKVPSSRNSPHLWGFVINETLAPGESWAGCLRPGISTKSNSAITKRRDDFDWAVDKVYADFAE